MRETALILRRAIQDSFHTHLLRLGFQPERKRDDFVSYRRIRSAQHELVEVQLDKYGRPRFVLNFGAVPACGIVDAYGRFIAAEDVQIAQLVQQGRLYSVPYSAIWFRPKRLFGIRSADAAVAKAISHLVYEFGQVEQWFETGACGPNIRVSAEPWNASGIRKKSMMQRGAWPPEGWTEEDERALRM